jgi:hypothetical protein
MLQVTHGPGLKGREANHTVGDFADDLIDPVRLGDGTVPVIVVKAFYIVLAYCN